MKSLVDVRAIKVESTSKKLRERTLNVALNSSGFTAFVGKKKKNHFETSQLSPAGLNYFASLFGKFSTTTTY